MFFGHLPQVARSPLRPRGCGGCARPPPAGPLWARSKTIRVQWTPSAVTCWRREGQKGRWVKIIFDPWLGRNGEFVWGLDVWSFLEMGKWGLEKNDGCPGSFLWPDLRINFMFWFTVNQLLTWQGRWYQLGGCHWKNLAYHQWLSLKVKP